MLTKRQKQILDYIKKYIKGNDYAPTHEEIRRHFRLVSKSTVHKHIEGLKKKGYLEKLDRQTRAIQISENGKNSDLVSIPLLGIIAAGQPIEAVEDRETITIPKAQLSRSGEHFALRVQGESMIDEGIFDGDTVIIRKQPNAKNGETVVALVNGNEATLKKIYKEKNGFRLQPANPKTKPIFAKELVIQGKVTNVIRKFEELEKFVPRVKIKTKETRSLKNGSLKKYLNHIFLGDIMDILKKLPDKSVDMIFGDPDYNVGIKYGNKAYTKTFDEYIDWYIELTKESMRVLRDDGNLFMLNYPKQNAHLRVKYLDSEYSLIHEYAWIYNTNVGHTPKRFTTAHRTILHVRKTKKSKFYKGQVALPYKNPTDKRILENLKNGSKGRMPYSWFYFDLVKNVSKEKTYHACQIPQKLTEMLIKSCTKPNDIALILFGGSGAELEVCKSLKRQYISAEIDKKYHELIVDRLKNGYIKKKYKLRLRQLNKEKPLPNLSLFSKAV